MGFLKRFFGTGEVPIAKSATIEGGSPSAGGDVITMPDGRQVVRWSPAYVEELVRPKVAGRNYMTLFASVPEVFFPIDYLASRVAGATFRFKRIKDDSVVWNNKALNRIVDAPNCFSAWYEFVYSHFVYRLATGNSYVRAAMADTFENAEKWRYCSNFWVLPADKMDVTAKYGRVPLFGIAEKEDIMSGYRLSYAENASYDIPEWQVWHDRELLPSYYAGSWYLKGMSRLDSLLKPIGNLLAVYEARNVIYVKRGGLGFLVGQKRDATGTDALTPKEREDLLRQHFDTYGFGEGQVPYGISNVPLSFVRTNLSIAELQPFDETLQDAITIAGAYGIPAVLVPRKDQSTFSNQSTAEKTVYASRVIPMAKKFCQEFSTFLGLTEAGYYLDCEFDDVLCLQEGLKEQEEVKTLRSDRCKILFENSIITLNDWRSQIGESSVDDPLFDKLRLDMTDEELDRINRVINKNTQGGDENGREDPATQLQD